tara:strand:+ start:17 stop:889 length:873 start_codon:yes stop_codon:yes gene_type:complete
MGLLDNQTQAQYQSSGNLGSYQYTSLDDIINNFIIAYVGENKLIGKVRRTDIAFHAQRGLAELSYDTLRSKKSQEIEVPSSTLQMNLPQDYVNYVKITWKDASGIEHILYPAIKTSNPKAITQAANGDYTLSGNELQYDSESDTWASYKSSTPSENQHDYQNDSYWPLDGSRYGIDPAHAQVNGSFYIDELAGKIHFSSNISGKTVTLKYVSDSLGTDGDQVVHKFAEEALYKHIAYAIVSTSPTIQEHIVRRFKKEKFAATRQAKLRLSNIKLEELAQVMRGKSKQIKH